MRKRTLLKAYQKMSTKQLHKEEGGEDRVISKFSKQAEMTNVDDMVAEVDGKLQRCLENIHENLRCLR